MPRALFPHSLGDVLHAVDGPFGLVVGDLPDGTIWVLKRGRELAVERVEERRAAVNRFSTLIGLGESL
jgi:streptogramin lyase